MWKACRCIDGLDGQPFVGCDRCGGTGWTTSSNCTLCGNIGRICYGVTFTVTDLEGFTSHLPFAFEADSARMPQRQFNIFEDERHRLPEEARLSRLLFELGIDLADVTDFHGLPVAADLLDGAAMVRADGPADALLYNYTARASAHRPGARVFLRVKPRPTATLDQLVRIGRGLGLDLAVAVEDRSDATVAGSALAGTRWGAALLAPEEALERSTIPLPRRYLAAALSDCLDRLPELLNITRRPASTAAVAAPQQRRPPKVQANALGAVLSDLAAKHGGVPVSTIAARIGSGACTVTRFPSLPEARYVANEVLAEAGDVPGIVAALRR